MYFFVITTIVLLSLSSLEVIGLLKKKRLLFCTISFLLWIFSFIRWEVGTDWDSYFSIFEDCDYIEWYEWGFLWLNRLVKHTVNNYSVLLAILGGILFYFQSKAILKLSILPLTTLFILWGTDLGNVFFVRQSIAIAILLYSIVQIRRRNLKMFILLVICATLIHAASIIFLPAYWIYHHRFSLLQIIVMFIISCILGSVGGTFLWGGVGDMLGGMYAAKLEGYMEQGADVSFNEGMSAAELYIRAIVGKLFLIIIFTLLICKKYKDDSRGMMNLFLFATAMLPITISVSPSLGTPYFCLQIFLMTYVLGSANRLFNKIVLLGILLVMTMFRLYLKLYVDYDGEAFLPFQTIFL